ncbi:unnamed protein product [Phytophthora fragariaefolia]|uniref:Unnamed protein product n=1 Tax=Phytophthora fragariaefolia TaxID=1490495 RepID=A0A9W6XAM8_9STRA|nr:unnamed protein product [Phytophthora fragariaefolia]
MLPNVLCAIIYCMLPDLVGKNHVKIDRVRKTVGIRGRMEVVSGLPTREVYTKSKMGVDLELITASIYGVDGQATGSPADGQVITIPHMA